MRSKKFLTLIGLTAGSTIASLGLSCVACSPKHEEKIVNIKCEDERVILSKSTAIAGEALEFKFKFDNDLCMMKSFDALLVGTETMPASGYYSVDQLTDDQDGWKYKVSISEENAKMITDDITLVMTLDYRPLKVSLLVDAGFGTQPSTWTKIDTNECTYESTPLIKIASVNSEVLALKNKPKEIRIGDKVLTEHIHYEIIYLPSADEYEYGISITDKDVVVNDIVIIWSATWKKVSIKIDEDYEYRDYVTLSDSVLPFNEAFTVNLTTTLENLYINDVIVKVGDHQLEPDYFEFTEIAAEEKMEYQLIVQDPDIVLDNIVITPVLSYQPYEVKVYDPNPFIPSTTGKESDRIDISRRRTEYGVDKLEIYAKPIETFQIESLSVKVGDKPLVLGEDYTIEKVIEYGSEWTHKITINNTVITNDVTICVDDCRRIKCYITATTGNDNFPLQIEQNEIATHYEQSIDSVWETKCSFDMPWQCEIDESNAKLYDNGKEVENARVHIYKDVLDYLITLSFPFGAVTFQGDPQIVVPVIDKPYSIEQKFVDAETKKPIEGKVTALSADLSHGFYVGTEFNAEFQLYTETESQDPDQIYFLAGINSVKLWGMSAEETPVRMEKELSNEPLTGEYSSSVDTEIQTKGKLSIQAGSIGRWLSDQHGWIDPAGMVIEFNVYKKETAMFNVMANDGVSTYHMGKYSTNQPLTQELNRLVIDKNKHIANVQLWTVIKGVKEPIDSDKFTFNPNSGELTVKSDVLTDPNLETLIIDARMQTIARDGFENESWDMLNYWLGNAYQFRTNDRGEKYQTMEYVNYVYGVPEGSTLIGREKEVSYDGFKQKVRLVDNFRYELEEQGSRQWPYFVKAPMLFEWSNVLHNGSQKPVTKVITTGEGHKYGFWQHIGANYDGWDNDSGIRVFLRSNEFKNKMDSAVKKYVKKIKKDILCHNEYSRAGSELWQANEFGEFAFSEDYTIGTCSDLNCTKRPNEDIFHRRCYDGTINDAANKAFKYYEMSNFPRGITNEPLYERIKYQYNTNTGRFDIPIQYSTCIPHHEDNHSSLFSTDVVYIYTINEKGVFNLNQRANKAIAFAPCFCI